MKFVRRLPSPILFAAILPATMATAQTVATDSFDVRITILAECRVVSTETLDFGAQGVLGAAIDASATLEVTCTQTTPYAIGLGQGLGSGATTSLRRMSSGGETVSYALFRDAARTANWGDTVGSDTQPGTGTGNPQAFTVFGRVPAQSTPAPGTYDDTVTVTVTY